MSAAPAALIFPGLLMPEKHKRGGSGLGYGVVSLSGTTNIPSVATPCP